MKYWTIPSTLNFLVCAQFGQLIKFDKSETFVLFASFRSYYKTISITKSLWS